MANNDQNNNKNGKGRNNLRGILTLVAWALVLTVGFNYLNAYNRNATNKSTSHEIKYSEMLDLIENDKAEEVLFKDDAIYITPVEGYTYTEKQDENSTVPAKSYTQSKDTKLTLLFSCVKEKDYDGMIRTICESLDFESVVVTQIDSYRQVPSEELAQIFRKYTTRPVEEISFIDDAFDEAMKRKGDGVLFCVGSLYLVGSLKSLIRSRKNA